MKKYYYCIENEKVTTVEAESKTELERFFGHGNVFENKADAVIIRDERRKPKVRHLSDEERKILEAEQIAYGRSQMTETELLEAKRQRKTIDQIQLEFGRMMMRLETA